jgi:hypothetical protein
MARGLLTGRANRDGLDLGAAEINPDAEICFRERYVHAPQSAAAALRAQAAARHLPAGRLQVRMIG